MDISEFHFPECPAGQALAGAHPGEEGDYPCSCFYTFTALMGAITGHQERLDVQGRMMLELQRTLDAHAREIDRLKEALVRYGSPDGAPERDVVLIRCDAVSGATRPEIRCEREYGHSGEHAGSNATGTRVVWNAQVGVQTCPVTHVYGTPCVGALGHPGRHFGRIHGRHDTGPDRAIDWPDHPATFCAHCGHSPADHSHGRGSVAGECRRVNPGQSNGHQCSCPAFVLRPTTAPVTGCASRRHGVRCELEYGHEGDHSGVVGRETAGAVGARRTWSNLGDDPQEAQ